MPSPTARRAHASVIQRVGNGAKRGRTCRLYLAHNRQHVGGEGVCRLPIGRYALGLRVGQVSPVSQNRALRLLLCQRRLGVKRWRRPIRPARNPHATFSVIT